MHARLLLPAACALVLGAASGAQQGSGDAGEALARARELLEKERRDEALAEVAHAETGSRIARADADLATLYLESGLPLTAWALLRRAVRHDPEAVAPGLARVRSVLEAAWTTLLRREFPRPEEGAGGWIPLRVEVGPPAVRVSVAGKEPLAVKTGERNLTGRIGLYADASGCEEHVVYFRAFEAPEPEPPGGSGQAAEGSR